MKLEGWPAALAVASVMACICWCIRFPEGQMIVPALIAGLAGVINNAQSARMRASDLAAIETAKQIQAAQAADGSKPPGTLPTANPQPVRKG